MKDYKEGKRETLTAEMPGTGTELIRMEDVQYEIYLCIVHTENMFTLSCRRGVVEILYAGCTGFKARLANGEYKINLQEK